MIDLPKPPGSFVVRVKPRCNKTCIVSYLDDVLFVDVAAPADKNKANVELVKFLSKQLGNQVRIKSGRASKEKTLVFL